MIFAVVVLLALAPEDVREAPVRKPPAAPQLTKAPQLVEFHLAVYPPERLTRGETADVACAVDIDEHGAVTQVVVEKGAAPDFDEAAVAAIRTFKFSPAELDGKPSPVRIRYVYHFVIERKRVERPAEPRGSVRGLVLEAGTRKPIQGATVADAESGEEAATDVAGAYELHVPAGDRKLSASAVGYARRELMEMVRVDSTTQARKIYLHRSAVGDMELTVEGEKVKDAPTRRTLQHDELVNVPGALNDPIRAVQNLPGLARSPFLAGTLLVRGSPPGDTGVYVDGHRVPLLYHFLGGPSVIKEQLVDRIDFYPGGYGAYYGRNLVGALDVGTAQGAKDALHGDVSLDLLEAVAFVTTPIGSDTSVAVAARRSHIDVFLPLFLRGNDPNSGVTTIIPIYWDYQARVDHKDLSLLFFGSDDKLTVLQTGGRRTLPISINTHTGFHRAVVTWKHDLSDVLSLRVSPALGWQVTSFDSSGAGPGGFANAQSLDLTQLSAELRAELRYRARSNLELRFGVDVDLERASYSADIQAALDLQNLGVPVTQRKQFTRVQGGAGIAEYVEANLKLGRLELSPGLRFDQTHWTRHERLTADPRLWARYTLDDDTFLKAYGGIYHQPPTGQQIDADVGNPDLILARSAQVGFGVERRLGTGLSVTAEVFYNRRYGRVTRADAIVDPAGTIYNPRLLNQGIGRSYGLELLVRRELTERLYGWIAYTLSKSQVINVPGDPWSAFNFDQPHILTVVAGYRPSPPWTLSARFRFVSGNPRAPVEFATFDADSGGFVAESGTLGDTRAPSFFQLDLRAKYTWIFDLWELSLYLDVQNVTNHRNEELQVFDYRFREQGSIPGIPILPTFGLKARF